MTVMQYGRIKGDTKVCIDCAARWLTSEDRYLCFFAGEDTSFRGEAQVR
jgi:hypothetical protein